MHRLIACARRGLASIRNKTLTRLTVLFASTLAVVALSGCSQPGAAPASPSSAKPSGPRPNVILIILDTLRSDHLTCYGYPRATSPRLDAFAAGATRYSRSFSTAPWTLPSHASIFTGKFPFQHGAHSFPIDKPVIRNAYPLHESNETLAEALQSEGFQTALIGCNVGYLGAWTKLTQGFDLYELEFVYANERMKRVFRWFDEEAKPPFFLVLNFMDTHRPYNTTPRPGFIDPPAKHEPRGTRNPLLTQLARAVMPMTGPVPEDLRQKVVDQYDTAIANLDEQLGRLFDHLKEKGLFDSSMVIVTSDHGEYFGEHFLVEHSKDVYQEALRVPLIVKTPGQNAGRVDDAVVCSTDVSGMIAAAMPADLRTRLQAKFPDAPGNHPVMAENYYSRPKDLSNKKWGSRFNRVRTVIYEWPMKYIHSSDDKSELYDLGADPIEAKNLIAERPEVAAKLKQAIDIFVEKRGRFSGQAQDDGAISEADLRAMESLGYAGRAHGEEEEESSDDSSAPATQPSKSDGKPEKKPKNNTPKDGETP